MPTPSSTTFANAPIHALLQQPVHEMNEEQSREYVKTLRLARTNHQAFVKQLKIDSETAKPKKTKTSVSETEKKRLSDEYLSGL